ncbi:MAG: HipA domain-containing protein [Methanomassiliicoccaceae archaeon]|nr:HipA domain-containing protein [Methanomassiliicoccaceae archaeon]
MADTFNGKPIRTGYSDENKERMFSAVDVITVLAEPSIPRNYWSDLKRALKQEGNELHEKIVQLRLPSLSDGRSYKTDVLNKEGVILLARRIKGSEHTEAFIEWLTQFDGTGRSFVLKHKDIDVIELELDESGSVSSFGRTLNDMHLPVGTVLAGKADHKAIREWWNGRSIPASREGLRGFLESLNMSFPQELLKKSFGLSLSDHYWICPQNAGLRWSEVNFFHNEFSEDVGNMLFGKMNAEEMDAVSLLSPDNTSDGVLKKKWKIINGKRCLIKGGSKPFNQEVANEVLASRICGRLGIPFINYEVIRLDGEKYCVCEDFINGDTELVTAWHIKNLIKKDNSVSDHESFIAKAEELGIPDARRKIDMMIVLDFIIVNTDRHYNNFGLIRDANTLRWSSVAPIYDSGTSMWCKELPDDMDAGSSRLESKPFRSKQSEQIKLVKDLSWIDLDALEGIEKEYADILFSVSDSSELAARNRRLCIQLKRRIDILKHIMSTQH